MLVRAFRSRDRFRPSRLHHPWWVVVHRLRLRSVYDHHLLWHVRIHRSQLPSVARTQTHEKRERTDQEGRPETRETRNRAEILFLDEEEPRGVVVPDDHRVARGVDDGPRHDVRVVRDDDDDDDDQVVYTVNHFYCGEISSLELLLIGHKKRNNKMLSRLSTFEY